MRRLLIGIVALAVMVAFAPAAQARDLSGVPANLTETQASAHFLAHYTTTANDPNATSAAAVNTMLGIAEAAEGTELSWGFPPPVDDGDGRIDVYVYTRTDLNNIAAVTRKDSASADQTSAWISVRPQSVTDGRTIAHELFHVLQNAVWAHRGTVLSEATATWASSRVNGAFNHTPAHLLPDKTGKPLDCPAAQCTDDIDPYRQWAYFEHLDEHVLPGAVLAILREDAVLGATDHASHDFAAIDAVLAAHGRSLATSVADWAAVNAVGNYTYGPLAGQHAATEATVTAATPGAPEPPRTVTLDHYASRFVAYTGGCSGCYLRLTVSRPPGLDVRPQWVPDSGPVAAFRAGPLPDTFETELPWSGSQPGTLAVSNTSATADAQLVTVTPSVVTTPTPSITLAAKPKVVRKKRKRILLVTLSATASGTVQVLLGTKSFKARSIVAGLTRLKLSLPKHTHAGPTTLVLTPLAADGHPGVAFGPAPLRVPKLPRRH